MSDTNALMVVSKKARGILETWKGELSLLAQRDYNYDVWMRSVVLAIVESDMLTKCLNTQEGQISLIHALKYAAATGLSLNPQEGKCALVPYAGKISYQVMKNGLIDLALADPKVRNFRTLTVRENDNFSITQGMDGDEFNFSPDTRDRGEIIGFFAALKMENGPSFVKYMTREEVEKHRDKYSAMWKSKNKANSPWYNSFEGMGEKTIAKSLLRTTSISSDLDILVGTDDKAEAEMIDITPVKSLEDSVEVIEDAGAEVPLAKEMVDKGMIEPAAEEKIDPPTGKDADNPIDHDDVKKIFAKLHGLGVKDALDQHAEVSDILGFNSPVTSFSYLNSMQAGLVIGQLEEREEAAK